jgi:ketosteroid isomerase-like protein
MSRTMTVPARERNIEMPAKTPETVARALADSLSSGDFSTWEAQLAPNFTASYPGMRGSHGKAAALAFNKVFPVAFPDLQFAFTNSARSGDVVYLSMTAEGTHLGPLASPAGAIAPTGRRGVVDVVFVVTVKDGRIEREESYWNVADLIEQLTAPHAAAA